MVSSRFLVIIGAFFLILSTPLVLVGPVGGSSEAREAHIAALMVETGNYVLPSRDGILPSKPPLFHWLSAGVIKVAQVSPVTATRFVSLCAATCLLVITMYGAYRLSEDEEAAFPTAIAAGFILSLTYTFERMRMTAMVDMLLAFCSTASALCLLVPIITTDRETKFLSKNIRSANLYGAGFFAALGVVTKGPLGLALPGFIVIFTSVLLHGWKESFVTFLKPHGSWIAFLALSLPWYYFATQQAGDGFVDRQIVFENIARIVGGDFVNSQPWWFYFPSFFRTGAPWSVLAVISFGLCVRYRLIDLKKDASILIVLAGMALFSLSSGKRHSYLLPLFPFLAIWLAIRRDDFIVFFRKWIPTTERVTTYALVALLFMVASLAIVLNLTNAGQGALSLFQDYLARYSPALFSSTCTSLILFFCLRFVRQPYGRTLQCWTVLLAFVALVTTTGEGIKNYLKGFDRMAFMQRQLIPSTDSIGIVRHVRDEYFDPLMMYLDRPATILNPDTLSANPPTDWILIQRRDERLLEEAGLFGTKSISFKQPADVLQGREDRDVILLRVQ